MYNKNNTRPHLIHRRYLTDRTKSFKIIYRIRITFITVFDLIPFCITEAKRIRDNNTILFSHTKSVTNTYIRSLGQLGLGNNSTYYSYDYVAYPLFVYSYLPCLMNWTFLTMLF